MNSIFLVLLLHLSSIIQSSITFHVQGLNTDPLLSIMSLQTTPPSSFYHTKESVDKYMEMADGVNGLELIEKLLTFVSSTEKGRILEIGSGPGSDYEILLNKFASYEIIGSDYSLEFLKRLKTKFSDKVFLHFNAATMEAPTFTDKPASEMSSTEADSCLAAGVAGGPYDIIYSNKVLHHLSDDELLTSLQNQLNLLKPNGIVSHSFWKGEGTEDYDGMFVNNHTLEELRKLFETCGFSILHIEHYKEFDNDDSIHVIAQKKAPA